ncbi:MAG: hypothetical protein Alpg2KO_22610 [Alphaproteobacteria bacterium]
MISIPRWSRPVLLALGLALPAVVMTSTPADAQSAAELGALQLSPDERRILETPPLLTLLENGLTLIRMGDDHGFEAWMGKAENGSVQTYYITPDRQAMIAGIMYDSMGVGVTEHQIRRRMLQLANKPTPPRPEGTELPEDTPVTPHANKWRTSPPLFRLARQGVTFSALPIMHGVEVFLGIAPKTGEEQTFYLSPDNKALVVGILYDATGQDLTWKQIYQYAQKKAADSSPKVELAPQVQPAPGLRIEPAPPVTRESTTTSPLRASPMQADSSEMTADEAGDTAEASADEAQATAPEAVLADPEQSSTRGELAEDGAALEDDIQAFFDSIKPDPSRPKAAPAVDLTRTERLALPDPGKPVVRRAEMPRLFDPNVRPEQAVQDGIEGRMQGVDPTAELPPIEQPIPAPRTHKGFTYYSRSGDPTLGERRLPNMRGMSEHAMRNPYQAGLHKAEMLAKPAAPGMLVQHGPVRAPDSPQRDYSNLPYNKAMQAALEDTYWFSYGRKGAPVVYMTFDPACPWCEQAWEDMRPLIEAGAFEARIIMTSFLTKVGMARAAAILDANDPIKALETYHGRMAQTPTQISQESVQEIQYNMLVVRRLERTGTPRFFFMDKANTWMEIEGLPRNLQAELVGRLP